MIGQPLLRISQSDLERLMAALEVRYVSLSECALSAGRHLAVASSQAPMMQYSLSGCGVLFVGDESPIEVPPHTLVVIPRNTPVTITASGAKVPTVRHGIQPTRSHFVPGSKHQHKVGEGEPALTILCGNFHAAYGALLDLFASLASPIVEKFDASEKIDQLMKYVMAELSDQDIGGAPMSRALFKLALLALLRRSLVSARPWVERLSLLSDPPIARAFAEMAAGPSALYTVHSLAQSVGLSRSAFMARFAVACGESPMVVLRRLRMRQAASLLAANALSIDQVATQAGYQSRSSFTRTFRKLYGSDPSEFRAAARRAALAATGTIDDGPMHGATKTRLPDWNRA